jgi:hypothetical protein
MGSKRRTPGKASKESHADQAGIREYIPFPRALDLLAGRLSATADEIAAWVWLTPDDGGLCAYSSANELKTPPRFYFGALDHELGADYLAPLMSCWFDKAEVEGLSPRDRFITGRDLIERWGKRPGIQAEAFIVAKVAESRLCDLHPIFGGTRATDPQDATLPPLESGLFCVADIEAIEATDFCDAADRGTQNPGAARAPSGLKEYLSDRGRKAANARYDKPGARRDQIRQIRAAWASGKYKTKALCAEEEYDGIGLPFSSALKALRNQPKPKRA